MGSVDSSSFKIFGFDLASLFNGKTPIGPLGPVVDKTAAAQTLGQRKVQTPEQLPVQTPSTKTEQVPSRKSHYYIDWTNSKFKNTPLRIGIDHSGMAIIHSSDNKKHRISLDAKYDDNEQVYSTMFDLPVGGKREFPLDRPGKYIFQDLSDSSMKLIYTFNPNSNSE